MYRTKTMVARFPGKCASHICSKPIEVGDVIVHIRKGTTYHVDCDGAKRITRTYFPSTGNEYFQNANGRCEDAPCCGCCSY
jgi:hypothetical protein